MQIGELSRYGRRNACRGIAESMALMLTLVDNFFQDFLTSHIKPQQGGLAQMALGVIGRFSNSNSGKPGGQQAQHNKPHAFHQVFIRNAARRKK